MPNKDYTSSLYRNPAWRKRRQKIIARTGNAGGPQSPLNEIQAPCHSARNVPCRKKKKDQEVDKNAKKKN